MPVISSSFVAVPSSEKQMRREQVLHPLVQHQMEVLLPLQRFPLQPQQGVVHPNP